MVTDITLTEFQWIYQPENLRHAKCLNPEHDEYGHMCEEMVELKAAINAWFENPTLENFGHVAEELADIVIVANMYAGKAQIDLATYLIQKTIQNYKNGRLAKLPFEP